MLESVFCIRGIHTVRRQLTIFAVAVTLLLWIVAFLMAPWHFQTDRNGNPMPRGIILFSDAPLTEGWFGDSSTLIGFLTERGPIWFGAVLWALTAAGLGGLVWQNLFRSLRNRDTGEYTTDHHTGGPIDRFGSAVLATALGWSLLATMTLVAGLAGWLRPAVFLAVPLAVAAMWCVKFLRRQMHRGNSVISDDSGSDSGSGILRTDFTGGAWWLLLTLPFVAAMLLAAPLPPVEFDVCEYHAQVPKEWYQAGWITYLPHNVYGNMPLGAEIPSLAFSVLSGDPWRGEQMGKTAISIFTLLTAAAIFAAVRRPFGLRAAAVAAVVYLSIPWIVQNSTFGQIDASLAGYTFLTAWMLFYGRSDPTFLILAGFFAGSAAACKYTAVPMVVFPTLIAAAIFIFRNTQATMRRRWTAATIVAAVILVGGGGWYVKNAVLTGNPVYPLASNVFPTPDWPEPVAARWNNVHRAHDFSITSIGNSVAIFMLHGVWNSPLITPLAAIPVVLLAATCIRRRFLRKKPANPESLTVSPAPAISSVPGTRWIVCCVAWVGGILMLWWAMTHRLERFAIPAMPFMAALAGIGFERIARHGRVMRLVATVFLLIGLGWNGFVIGTMAVDTAFFVPFAELEAEPMRVSDAHRRINDDPEFASGVLLITGDATPFDLRRPILYHTCWNASPLEQFVVTDDPSETRRQLTVAGVTHVFVDWREITRYRSPGNYGFSDFVQPELFRRLCDDGVLEYIPATTIDGKTPPDSARQFFRVRSE